MKHEESRFTGYMKFNIYYQYWIPGTDVIAIILIAHGYAEHSGRYMNVVNYFVPKGYAVYALDHRGHGRSDGNISEISDFSHFITDLKTFFDIIHKKHPGKKIFLIGHSMGSVISLLYMIKYQDELAGLVISGGGIAKPGGAPMPPRPPNQPLDSSFISRDPEVIKAYENDPLVYRGPIPQGIQSEMSERTRQLAKDVKEIKLPVIIMAGDGGIDGARSQVLYDYLGSSDKTLKRYAGLKHEIFNEPEHPQVMADLERWLEMHL
jgi:alpha-beta hydrolase superfamily lysophospholipase